MSGGTGLHVLLPLGTRGSTWLPKRGQAPSGFWVAAPLDWPVSRSPARGLTLPASEGAEEVLLGSSLDRPYCVKRRLCPVAP